MQDDIIYKGFLEEIFLIMCGTSDMIFKLVTLITDLRRDMTLDDETFVDNDSNVHDKTFNISENQMIVLYIFKDIAAGTYHYY